MSPIDAVRVWPLQSNFTDYQDTPSDTKKIHFLFNWNCTEIIKFHYLIHWHIYKPKIIDNEIISKFCT